MPEEQNRSPIIAKVLRERARCTCRERGKVERGVHAEVEGVTSDDLVEVRGDDAWGDEPGLSMSAYVVAEDVWERLMKDRAEKI